MLSKNDEIRLKKIVKPFLVCTRQLNKLMVMQLVRNIKKKGKGVVGRESWLNDPKLDSDFDKQIRQFRSAMYEAEDAKTVWLKAADVANYAMLLADRHKKRLEEGLEAPEEKSSGWTEEQKIAFENLFVN